jgi:hypothetical protein
MNLIQRVQDILLKPKEAWPTIAQEPATPASIYTEYLIFIAAIPAVAGFIGLSLIGAGAFGVGVRVPVVAGLVQMVVGYVLSLAMVFVLALIVDALAPAFGGSKDRIGALKLVAYGSTAAFVGGIFSLLPALSILGLVAALYSIYLIYTGVPVLMKSPPDKAAVYTAVIIVCGIVAGVVLGAVMGLAMPSSRGLYGGAVPGAGDITIKTPSGSVSIDTAKLEEAAKKMEEAGKRMEQAQRSGDAASAGKAMSDVAAAMSGAAGPVIAAQDLKALLPPALGDLKRESLEAQGGQAMGIAGSSANAVYAGADRRIELRIADMGSFGALAAQAAWMNMTVDRETNEEIEKVYKQGGRTVREEARKDGSHAETSVILESGVMVEANGDRVDLATLKKALERIDLAKLETLKRTAKK